MKKAGSDPTVVERNRTAALAKYGIDLSQTILVHVTYDGDDYRRFRTVTDISAGEGMTNEAGSPADGLFTNDRDLALFLPLADCVGVVVYDPTKDTLGVVHLGRHNLEQHAGTRAIEYMKEQFGCSPKDIRCYLSPAAGKFSYPLCAFARKGLQDVATEQLIAAGIEKSNIERDERDTTTDASLFSHSEFLKGCQDSDGRHALVAVLH